MIAFFQNIFVQFHHQLQNNQFLIGMLTTAMLGAGAFVLRSVPKKVGNFLFRIATIEATFRSDDSGFAMANEFVLRTLLIERLSRVFLLVFSGRKDRYAPDSVRKPLEEDRNFQVGYGRHFGWYRGRPVIVHREEEKDSQSSHFKETVRVVFFTKDRNVLNEFVAGTKAYIEASTEVGTRIYTSGEDYWQEHTKVVRRSLDSLFLPESTKRDVVGHFESFLANEETYLRRGIPFHTGIFLYGPPGTGKSSLIHALASHFRRSIRYLNLAAIGTDRDLISLFGIGWDDSILVIEDIDSATSFNEPEEEKPKIGTEYRGGKPPRRVSISSVTKKTGVSLSSLLNALDGLLTPHGLIVIATANNRDLLPPALMREGRFDLQVELGLMEWPEFVVMAKAFDRNPLEYLGIYSPMPPVEARNLLLGRNDTARLLGSDGQSVGQDDVDPARQVASHQGNGATLHFGEGRDGDLVLADRQ